MFLPRPAAAIKSAFPGFTTPGFVSTLLVVGDIAYGMISSGRTAGKDEPFAYDIASDAFLTVSGITALNVPTSPPSTGPWVPPIMDVVGTRIVVTHPGFPGGAIKFGWFDISNFTSATLTGTTTTGSPNITAISSNALQAGWQPGMSITGAHIPAGTTLVSIASDGLSAVMSANATAPGGIGDALTVTGGTPGTPQWAAGDTNVNPLPSVPVGVAQMNGRAWYLVGNGVVFSDSLEATNVTNASQALTFANGLKSTAIGQLFFEAPLTGGVVQSLIVFQGVSAMQQVIGDPATSNLSLNAIKAGTGTLAPLSVVSTVEGLLFVAPDGMRSVDLSGRVSDPIGQFGQGVTVPFIYSDEPSRICSAVNASVVRVSNKNGFEFQDVQEEWWYDTARKAWTGPHTFPASLIQPWRSSFLMTPVDIAGSLWQSDTIVTNASNYMENGVPLTWNYKTALLPDNGDMAMNAVVETSVAIALLAANPATATMVDENGSPLGSCTLRTIAGSETLWGAFVWGAALWGSFTLNLKQHICPWPNPLVFKQAQFSIAGQSLPGVKIGNTYLRYQILGYVLQGI